MRSDKFLAGVLAGSCMLGLVAEVAAEEAVAATDFPAALETVTVTASRHRQPIYGQAISASVLDRDELALLGQQHIQQGLARTPGANFARGNGLEYLPALRSPVLSGAGACGSLLAEVDGVPLRAAGFCNINELFEAGIETAERIEIIRGPAGTLHGANAMHGVVNIISPSAQQDLVRVGLEGGPHDYLRNTLSWSRVADANALRMDLSLSGDGGYRADSGFAQQKLALRHQTSAGAWQVSNSLAAANLNQETAGYIAGEGAYRNRDLSRSNPNPEAYRDARSARFASEWLYRSGRGAEIKIVPYLRYAEMEFMQHFLPGTPLERNRQRSAGVRSSLQAEIAADWLLTAGLDAEITSVSLLELQEHPAEGTEFLVETIPAGRHYDYRVDARLLAPFAQLGWQASDRTHFTAGLRFEQMQYDYDNRMLAGRTAEDGSECGFGGCRFSRPADRGDSFRNWSPSLGMTYQLAADHQAFASASHGFRPPQASELYRLQRDQQTAELDSEQLAGIESGLRGAFSAFDYQLAVYAMRKRNVIFRDADFFNQSRGRTEHQGVELALDYRLGQYWKLGVSGSYAEHRYRDRRELDGEPLFGKMLESAPRHFGSARLTWLRAAGSRAELEWLHQGAFYTDPHNRHSYPGHDLLNLRAYWQLDRQWSLQLQLLNLANAAYAERADYTSFAGPRYFPGEPRSLYVGIAGEW